MRGERALAGLEQGRVARRAGARASTAALGLVYLARGLALLRSAWPAYLLIALVYAAPALLAAALTLTVAAPAPWLRVLIDLLPWLTAILGTVAMMIAIGDGAHGRPVRLGRATAEGLRWTPRYLWTNAHTSLIFWLPMALLAEARVWQETALPLDGAAGLALTMLWWLLIIGLGLSLHTRTLLAPFLAVHGDLPGTLATLEAWRLSGRHFARCLVVLVLGSLPAALPLGLLALGSHLLLGEPAARALTLAGPALLWAAIQVARPVLMPAVYALYTDLWSAEQARRAAEGAPPPPPLARLLLALTRWLPHLPAWRRGGRATGAGLP